MSQCDKALRIITLSNIYSTDRSLVKFPLFRKATYECDPFLNEVLSNQILEDIDFDNVDMIIFCGNLFHESCLKLSDIKGLGNAEILAKVDASFITKDGLYDRSAGDIYIKSINNNHISELYKKIIESYEELFNRIFKYIFKKQIYYLMTPLEDRDPRVVWLICSFLQTLSADNDVHLISRSEINQSEFNKIELHPRSFDTECKGMKLLFHNMHDIISNPDCDIIICAQLLKTLEHINNKLIISDNLVENKAHYILDNNLMVKTSIGNLIKENRFSPLINIVIGDDNCSAFKFKSEIDRIMK